MSLSPNRVVFDCLLVCFGLFWHVLDIDRGRLTKSVTGITFCTPPFNMDFN